MDCVNQTIRNVRKPLAGAVDIKTSRSDLVAAQRRHYNTCRPLCVQMRAAGMERLRHSMRCDAVLLIYSERSSLTVASTVILRCSARDCGRVVSPVSAIPAELAVIAAVDGEPNRMRGQERTRGGELVLRRETIECAADRDDRQRAAEEVAC
jgi:hypothetical protein